MSTQKNVNLSDLLRKKIIDFLNQEDAKKIFDNIEHSDKDWNIMDLIEIRARINTDEIIIETRNNCKNGFKEFSKTENIKDLKTNYKSIKPTSKK